LVLAHSRPALVSHTWNSQSALHAPLLQSCPSGQRLPQAPQFPGSLLMAAQAPLHSSSPVGHRRVQRAPSHSMPSGQALPQRPQWAGSEAADTQRSPHRCCPAGQFDVSSLPASGPWTAGPETSPVQAAASPQRSAATNGTHRRNKRKKGHVARGKAVRGATTYTQ
jgi:hypothetical protein